MSAWSPDFDLVLLDGVIRLCSWLAAGSVVLWLGCFVVRTRHLRRDARDAAAEESLIQLVLAEITGPARAAGTLTGLPAWQQPLLRRVFENTLNQIKGADQTKLVDLMRREGFLQAALQELGSSDPAVRQAAAGFLSYDETPAALAALQHALQDRDLGVQLTAARALLQRDQIASLSGLLADLDFLPHDPPLVLSDIFARLPASLHPEAVQLLGTSLPDEWKRMLAIALGRNQVHAAFAALAALARTGSERVRAAAWVALRELGDPQVGELVGDGLRDSSVTVRQAACQCAAALGGPDVLPPLLALLAEANWGVRFAAANALYDHGREGRQLLADHSQPAGDADVGRQVLREREREDTHGS